MKEKKIKILFFFLVTIIVFSVYLYSVAPTASFWDCSELIAVSYILGIPHPPGTPLYVNLGRIFSMIPIAKEVAYRTNFFTALLGAISCGFVYLLVVKLLSLQKAFKNINEKYPFLIHFAGIIGGLSLGFAFSFWDNSVETEVYTPCVIVALTVIYLAILWREKLERQEEDNRYVLAAIFILFLSGGIHFTPVMIFIPLLIYGLIVNRKALLELRFIEFIILYLLIVLLSGLVLVDYFVLFLASPLVAVIDLYKERGIWFFVLIILYGFYLYYLSEKKKLKLEYVLLGLFLIALASSIQFFLMARARLEPAINEVAPVKWRDFVSVLKREQYDPMRLLPRKTQFLTEEEWRAYPNSTPYLGVIPAYFEQIKFYLRYFFWQWAGRENFDIFLGIKWPAIIGLIFPILGIWGMVEHYKNEKKSFLLIFLSFLIASLGLITYLNLKYSPSDPRPHLKFREVRERDYFFAFSYVFFTIFVGMGTYYFLNYLLTKIKIKKIPFYSITAALTLVAFLPVVFNYPDVTRRYNMIPAEYGYNMLISCEGEKAVVFTNGDNDTFPLWFVQETPSVVNNYQVPFKRNVAVANLSLLNTNWYCKQLKKWGAPISFSLEEIDKLPQGMYGKDGRVYLLKDIIIRDMLATNSGIKLKYPDDYLVSPHEFRQKVLKNYKNLTGCEIYFATTVSKDNLYDVEPFLVLKGLVQQVTADSGDNQIDLEKTEEFLFSKYKMKSMLDPKVKKDENTRGLLLNYVALYVQLAQEYYKRGDIQKAIFVLEKARAFELDPDKKAVLFYNLSLFNIYARDYQKALAYLDSIENTGIKDAQIYLQRGLIYQSLNELKKAEESYLKAKELAPLRPEPVQTLYQFYLHTLNDSQKAINILREWLFRNPNDTVAQRLLKNLEKR
jgi:tetratricopeptide (TPR) repeat protein